MSIFDRFRPNRDEEEENEYSFPTNDLLIVFNEDSSTSDINYITEIDDESITVEGLYQVPIIDCDITTGKSGRNFFYRAPQKSIQETERLAKLEHSIVLTQITSYEPPILPNSIDWVKGLLFAMLFVAMIVIVFVS